MYSEKIMGEFLNPQNYGVIKGASSVGKVVSDIGSEIVKFFIKVEDNRIVDCKFQTFGGVVAIALSSLATTLVIGKTVLGAKRVAADDLSELAGEIPESKAYLVNIVMAAVDKALENYDDKSED
ncbi:MAG: iron-sulfur cluster assembly scaffold protein [Clostridia bacterium]|nr:iron-sulfur cluster assembly scaffold protein [Clostridia bacterium]